MYSLKITYCSPWKQGYPQKGNSSSNNSNNQFSGAMFFSERGPGGFLQLWDISRISTSNLQGFSFETLKNCWNLEAPFRQAEETPFSLKRMLNLDMFGCIYTFIVLGVSKTTAEYISPNNRACHVHQFIHRNIQCKNMMTSMFLPSGSAFGLRLLQTLHSGRSIETSLASCGERVGGEGGGLGTGGSVPSRMHRSQHRAKGC